MEEDYCTDCCCTDEEILFGDEELPYEDERKFLVKMLNYSDELYDMYAKRLIKLIFDHEASCQRILYLCKTGKAFNGC